MTQPNNSLGADAVDPAATAPGVPSRTLVMGILNVTEDSFSDGGANPDTETAVRNALAMIEQGADIIDIGGESTRPGATRVNAEREQSRVVPVVQQLRAHPAVEENGVLISVDTMRASTARAAVEAGAHIINDVSGGLADEDMLEVAASVTTPDGQSPQLCLMHWNAESFAGAEGYRYHGQDIVEHVRDWLQDRADAALAAGVSPDKLILDPGIGFAKNSQDNWALLGAVKAIADLGYPVLVGASRKRFLTALRPGADGQPGTPESADDATAAVSALSAHAGAWAVRVHKVAPNRAAVDVAYALASGKGPEVDETWRARRTVT